MSVTTIDKEKTLQAAQKAVEKKKYDLAIDLYRKLALAERNDPRWLLKIGDIQQKKGDFAAAIATYEEVARFYSGQGFHLKAVAVYNTVRELLAKQPPTVQAKYAHVAVRLAELYEKLQLTSDALATWETVAERLQREGRDREAVDVFRRIVSLDPANPLSHLRLAEALSRQKDVEGAIEEFAATAQQLTAQHRIDDALKVYERLLHHRQDPKYARPAAELYLTRNNANDGVAAIAKLQICLKSDSKSVELIAMLARAFVAIGQSDKAITIYKESARLADEQKKPELRQDIVRRLRELAPQDDQVRALVREVLGVEPPSSRHHAAAATTLAAPMPAQPRAHVSASSALAPQPSSPPVTTSPVQARIVVTGSPPRAVTGGVAMPAPTAARAAATMDLDAEELEDLDAEELEDLDVDDREAAEEITDVSREPAREHQARVAEVVASADSFRKNKLYAKALTTLRIGLELDPRSVPVRERVRDVLIETGETDLAIAEMVTLSAILLEERDLQGAYDNLIWILEADPAHPQAVQLMDQLQEMAAAASASAAAAQPIPQVADLADDEPDVTEVDLGPIPQQVKAPVNALDVLEELAAEPLPSYDLDDDGATIGSAAPDEGLPSYELEETYEVPSGEVLGAESVGALDVSDLAEVVEDEGDAEEVEAALEEADFYLARGVYETARETIEEALKGAPRNGPLVAKLKELDRLGALRTSAPPTSVARDRPFDLSASLDALDALEVLDKVQAQPSLAPSVDVEEVFANFKAEFATQVEASDSQTHYDLGIAYEQMMRYDDAIKEFRVAARDRSREALCYSMIGRIYAQRGSLPEATDAFQSGLSVARLTRDEELALLYDLGAVWEQRRNPREAIHAFRRIVSLDATYRDAKGRLAALGVGGTEQGSGARAKNDIDDDLDAAFDSALGKR